jgi:hypothetical protein
MWALILRLLFQGAHIFIPTTSRSELLMYALIPRRIRMRGRTSFYVHQIYLDVKKRKALARLAKKITDAHVICTHPELTTIMTEAGFGHGVTQPYPIIFPAKSPSQSGFRALLFPGMARIDKGLAAIIALVGLLKQENRNLPVIIQAAPNHHGSFSEEVSLLLKQAEEIRYEYFAILRKALDEDMYRKQFDGCITLQPYDPKVFDNRLSGVTLDALAANSPVIACSNTWTGQQVEKYGFGRCLPDVSAKAMIEAIDEIMEHFPAYQQRCFQAREKLAHAHHPMRLLERLTS